MNLTHVLQFAFSQTWAMEPGAHRTMMAVLLRHADGVKLTEEELTAATGSPTAKSPSEMIVDKHGIARIPIRGTISHRAGSVTRVSRVGTSVEQIRADLDAAIEDDAVKAIVLDVDSPGGSVAGIEELGADIRSARARKPIVAHTDGMMASAAFWLSAQANKVLATKGAEVGSIGVISAFYDNHRAAANSGYDPVVIKSTPGKGTVQGNGTLSDADRADIQRTVDAYHGMFIDAVAAGRGIDRDKAATMADGKVYIGADAQARGYIDGVATLAGANKVARTLARERAAAAAAEPNGHRIYGGEDCRYRWEDCETDFGGASTGKQPSASDGNVAVAGARSEDVTMEPKNANTGAPTPAETATVAQTTKGPDAAAAERERCVAINRSAAAEQRELADKLIADGTSTEKALLALNEDLRARLNASRLLPSAATAPLAAGNTAKIVDTNRDAEKARVAAMADGVDKWKAEFAASPELQAEFDGDVSLYIGWQKNELAVAANKAGD